MGVDLWNRQGQGLSQFSDIGNDGSILGTPSYSPGKFGDATLFDAGTEGIIYGNVQTQNQGAVSFWYKPDYNSGSFPESFAGFFWSKVNASEACWQLQHTTSGTLTMFSPGNTSLAVAVTFTAGTWYHLAIVWNTSGIGGGSDTMRIYKDRVQIASTTTAPSTANFTGSKRWGSFTTNLYPAYGLMDNLKTYDYDETDFSNDYNYEGFGGAKRRCA